MELEEYIYSRVAKESGLWINELKTIPENYVWLMYFKWLDDQLAPYMPVQSMCLVTPHNHPITLHARHIHTCLYYLLLSSHGICSYTFKVAHYLASKLMRSSITELLWSLWGLYRKGYRGVWVAYRLYIGHSCVFFVIFLQNIKIFVTQIQVIPITQTQQLLKFANKINNLLLDLPIAQFIEYYYSLDTC